MPVDPRNPGSNPQPVELADAGLEIELIVSGDLDLATRDELLVRIVTVAMTSRRRIVVDLTDVDCLDAAGARALRQGFRLAAELGVDVVLRHPQRQVRRVLDLTGIVDVMPIS